MRLVAGYVRLTLRQGVNYVNQSRELRLLAEMKLQGLSYAPLSPALGALIWAWVVAFLTLACALPISVGAPPSGAPAAADDVAEEEDAELSGHIRPLSSPG